MDFRYQESELQELVTVLYLKYATSFVKKLNCFYSIVIIDSKRRKVLLAVDRFGSPFPIYYRFGRNCLFSIHMRFLKPLSVDEWRMDPENTAIFLKHSYVPSPRMVIQGIRKLGPGEFIIFEKGGIKVY